MTTVLIIAGIGLIGFLAWKGSVNFKKKKRERKPDLTVGTLKTKYSTMEYELINRINLHRVNKEFKRLEINKIISTVAKEHSLYMVKKGSVSHLNAFLRRAKLVKAIGIKSSKEVVAYGQGTAAGILKMWLKSPSHKKAIEGKWTKFGLSIEPNILRRNYTTCIFTK